MKKIIFLLSVTAVAAIMIIVLGSSKKDGRLYDIDSKDPGGMVLMELFTSQGCSSCPPADEILGRYVAKNDARIIPLSFHVDYWNRLGWKDPFSNSKFTQRQHDYALKFGLESVYTPQLVVNGQKELVGNEEASIASVVNDLLKQTPAVKISIWNKLSEGNKVSFNYSLSEHLMGATINAALVQANAVTAIRAGENRGLKLNNYNVVRDLYSQRLSGTTGSFTLALPKGEPSSGFSIVLFVQDGSSGKISAAIKTAI